ncbi:MAG: citrate transporter [Ruminococcaceae bacterium]|nr:citrate transporter [Oscillospiraceae bacterium]
MTHPKNKIHPLIYLKKFISHHSVMCIAAVLALITSVIVPPDREYAGYFDLKTLTCLFCTLAVICALKNIRFFTFLARKIVSLTGNIKISVLALVYITFIGSMIIANDMALITFLPLGYFVLSDSGMQKYMAFTFIMQNIAANLGGMLTPFGNPQNLYLYSYFGIPTGEFTVIMLPLFIISVAMITALCLIFVKSEKIRINTAERIHLPFGKTLLYIILFAYSIAIVFRLIPFWTGLIIIPIFLIFVDPAALGKVDYALLLTFVFFFVFAGNMSRMQPVRDLFALLLDKSTLIFSVLCCQVMSNVPTAVLLSHFTDNYRELLMGVNIGGAGTMIASLASLITYREYTSHYPTKKGRYLLLFTAINIFFAVVLTLVAYFFLI